MENVWGSAEPMRMNAPSIGGEYLEAEVIDDGKGDETKRRRELRFARPLTMLFAVIFALGMVGGYIGGGALYATIDAADSLAAQLAGGLADENPVAPTAGGVPVGTTAITADGLRIRCAGSFVKPGKGGREPMVVVALEVQNVGDEKVVLRKSQFAAIAANGNVVEPIDQALARGDGARFYQFTSVSAGPGECFTVTSSFYEAADPMQVIYRPGKRFSGYGADCTAFEIGGEQETMMA